MMPSTNQHVCRYDPEHGTFNAYALSRHYAEQHPEHVPGPSYKTPMRCRICGRIVRNPSSHITNHRDATLRPSTHHYFDHVDPDDSRAAEQVAQLNRRAVERHRTPEPAHGPWAVDDIVLPVVHQLAQPSGMIPVDYLGAILVWRDATAAMLAAVTVP